MRLRVRRRDRCKCSFWGYLDENGLLTLDSSEVGDGLQMMVVTKDGIEEIYHDLKKD